MRLNDVKKSGFSVVEAIIIIVVIAVIGVLGYVAYDRFILNDKDNTSEVKEQLPVATDVEETAPEIKSVADLAEAKTALKNIDTSSSADSAELDSQIADF